MLRPCVVIRSVSSFRQSVELVYLSLKVLMLWLNLKNVKLIK